MKVIRLFSVILSLLTHLCSLGQNTELKATFDRAVEEFDAYEKAHGGFVQTDNVNMHYMEWGKPTAPTLIWVHGSFTNAFEMKPFASQLVAKGYRVIAIDYYGHGQTPIPEHEVSLYHVADDIHQLMETKNIDKAIVGGWSRGGYIATAFYDAYPGKVLGLILEDGGSVATNTYYHKMTKEALNERMDEIFTDRFDPGRYPTRQEAYQALYNPEQGGIQFELLAWLRQNKAGQWTMGPGTEALFHMDNKTHFLQTILRPTKATLFGESMALIEPKIIYRKLSVPMLIMDPVSENDLFPFEAENKTLQQSHPDKITLNVYEDTGHNIHYEKPEQFVKDVVAFLEKVQAYWQNR